METELVDNHWKRYPVKAMRIWGVIVVIIFAFPMGIIIYALFTGSFFTSTDVEISKMIFIVLAIIGVVGIIIFVLFIRHMERKFKDWYRSGLVDYKLNKLEVLEIIGNYLETEKYMYNEKKERHLLSNRWAIDYELPRNDFNLRLDYFSLGFRRGIVINIGPETDFNKGRIEKLRTGLSEEFKKVYG